MVAALLHPIFPRTHMTNILNDTAPNDQHPDDTGTDVTLDPIAQEPAQTQAGLGVPTASREPEAGVGTGMNPP